MDWIVVCARRESDFSGKSCMKHMLRFTTDIDHKCGRSSAVAVDYARTRVASTQPTSDGLIDSDLVSAMCGYISSSYL